MAIRKAPSRIRATEHRRGVDCKGAPARTGVVRHTPRRQPAPATLQCSILSRIHRLGRAFRTVVPFRFAYSLLVAFEYRQAVVNPLKQRVSRPRTIA